MNKLQFNRMATTVLFAVLVLVSSVALAQKPIKRPPKKVRQTTTQQVAKPPKKTVAPAKPTKGEINGHEWVDLGLSVKWATMNVGAYSPTDFGDYFAWGETFQKSEYTEENSETWGLDLPDISGNEKYDAARVYWGGSWRMPTYAEFKELTEKCKRERKTINGIDGYAIYGPNGNSIFLPAAGGCKGDKFNVNQEGYYWSSTPSPNDDPNEVNEASYVLYLIRFRCEGTFRNYGFPIRPVTK